MNTLINSLVTSPTTVVTYTRMTAAFSATSLVQPPHIDVKYADGTTHRYSVKLQNTFMVGYTIVAVWEWGIYHGILDSGDKS